MVCMTATKAQPYWSGTYKSIFKLQLKLHFASSIAFAESFSNWIACYRKCKIYYCYDIMIARPNISMVITIPPSSGLTVCSHYANYHWIATGTPLCDSMSQCGPVAYQCTYSSSGLPVCSNFANGLCIAIEGSVDEKHQPVWFRCSLSSGYPVCEWSSSVFQLCNITLDYHWEVNIGARVKCNCTIYTFMYV